MPSTRSGAGHDGSIGLLGAISIGVGGMVGGGIFAVLGEAVALAHGATVIAFLVAGVLALLTAYSYARLSVRYPSQGGTVAFVDEAFGVDLATGSINLLLWLSYLVTLALYAVAFGAYAMTFFEPPHPAWLRHALISLAIVLPVGVNLFDAAFVGESETIIVVVKLVLIAIVVGAGLPYVEGARLAPMHWSDPVTVAAAGLVIFVAYEGFELIANASQDVRDPERTLPRAYFASVVLVIVLYALVAIITVGCVPESEIAKAKDYALAAAARPALGAAGFAMVAIAALLATLSAINATVYGNARLGYTLAKDGEIPDVLARKTWNEPLAGVLVVGGLSLVAANLIELSSIAILASAGFLLVFAITNAAAVKLSATTNGSRILSAIGCVACLTALVVLLVRSYADGPSTLWIFSGFLAASVSFELIYPRLRRRPLRMDTGYRTTRRS